MRTLNGPMLQKLIARKMTLSGENGEEILPETLFNAQALSDIKPAAAPPLPVAPVVDSQLALVLKQNSDHMTKILAIEKSMVEVVKEISKPKPKKNWNCAVGRDEKGIIKTIKIHEE